MNFLESFVLILSPLFGLIAGSFLNVVIFRTEKDLTFGGRSFCPKCKNQLRWFDNIPLFSYLFLSGKCRYCKKKISPWYPAVEALTSLLFFLAAYLVFYKILDDFFNHFITLSGFITVFPKILTTTFSLLDLSFFLHCLEIIYLFFVLGTFLAIFLYDFKHLQIPDCYSNFGIYVAIVFNVFTNIFLYLAVLSKNNLNLISETFPLSTKENLNFFPINLSSFLGFKNQDYQTKIIHLKALFSNSSSIVKGNSASLVEGLNHPYLALFLESRLWSGLLAGLILASFFYLIVYISKETWMGMGDVKLALFMGIFLGTFKTFVAAMLAFEIGAVVGIALILFGTAKMKTALPFGPFLIIGTVLSLLVV